MDRQTEDIANRLLPLIQGSTHLASVVRINVEDDVDHDGDPILRIQVVVKGDTFRLDPRDTLNTSRLVWQALLERDDTRFPIIRYVSEGDVSRSANEAA